MKNDKTNVKICENCAHYISYNKDYGICGIETTRKTNKRPEEFLTELKRIGRATLTTTLTEHYYFKKHTCDHWKQK